MIVSCKIGLTYGYSFSVSATGRGGGGGKTPVGGTPFGGSYWEASPERSTFFRLQVYKRVCILLVEVYETVRKSVILVGKGPTGRRDAFNGCEKVEKRFCFCDLFRF